MPVFNPAWLLVPAVIGGGIAAWALLRDDDNDFVFFPPAFAACEPLSGVLKTTLLLSGAALAASLVFGGGTRHGTLSDVVPELLALPLLVVAGPAGLRALGREPLLACLFAAVIALFVLQLIPLPPFIWSVLPGRDTVAQFYTVAGMPLPWQPLSLSPGETWRAGLALLPALALFLATLTLSLAERQVLLGVAVAIGLISVPLGILQILGGDESELYFFQYTNVGSAVGFFANANHYAAFFYMLIPLSAALLSELPARRKTVPPLAILAGVVFAFLLGLALSRSRSALLLGVLSLLATFALILRDPLRRALTSRRGRMVAIIGVAAVLPIVLAMGLLSILSRFELGQMTADARWTMASVTWQALRSYFPIGSGLGTFERVYQLHEPAQAVMWELINHAHNDWLELILETGGVGLILVIAFLVWFGRTWARLWAGANLFDRQVGQAACIAIALVSFHSLWEYPLRTIALSTLFGFCCALLTPAREPVTSRRSRGGSHTRDSRSARRVVQEATLRSDAGARQSAFSPRPITALESVNALLTTRSIGSARSGGDPYADASVYGAYGHKLRTVLRQAKRSRFVAHDLCERPDPHERPTRRLPRRSSNRERAPDSAIAQQIFEVGYGALQAVLELNRRRPAKTGLRFRNVRSTLLRIIMGQGSLNNLGAATS